MQGMIEYHNTVEVLLFRIEHSIEWEKTLGETQTMRAGCSKADFRPAADPILGGTGPPKFNQLEVVTYRPGLVKFDARNFELSW